MILYRFCVDDQTLTFVSFVFCYRQGTVIQGFIPPSRIKIYLPKMIAGSIYRLINFYGSKSKTVYRVAEPDVIIAFSWNSVPLFSGTVLFSFLWIGSVSMVMKSLKRHVTSRGIFMVSFTRFYGLALDCFEWCYV